GHVLVDGRRIDVPSAQVKPGQTVEIGQKGRNLVSVREALEITAEPPVYLYRNKDEVKGTLSRLPERDEIPLPVPIEERLIIEYYSCRCPERPARSAGRSSTSEVPHELRCPEGANRIRT